MNEDTKTLASVPERWWHRLLRVIGYISVAMVLIITLSIQLDSAEYYTYAYSFEDAYDASTGVELDCHTYDTLQDISCGEFDEPKKFVEAYLDRVGSKRTRSGEQTIRELIEAAKKDKGLSDWDVASGLIGEKSYTYKMQSHWSQSGVLAAIGWAIASAFLWFLVVAALYKTILFVAYGHTKVKKVS
jgi:hypothetical protein